MESPGRSGLSRRLPALTVRGHPVALGPILLAVVAYVPLLLTRPGEVGADTKTYLYLDPGRLLSRAVSMWDPNIGFGTVTHQNIGYLWPMGPFYWLLDAVGVPDWVAQRLWLGSIILAAGLGMRWMLKELRWVGPGLTVAAFSYALSPYLLHYGARISVILLPFAGLPWLIGLAARSLRRGGWRWPSAFALVTLTVGGVNATSLLLVMVAPLLWFVHATFVQKEVTLRRALATGGRITVLTLITSLWWMAGLSVQGAYGIPILRYTETYYVVANAAVSTELLRGLGYWFFYGRDALGAWIRPAETMVQSLPAMALSFLLPVLSFASGVLSRFRHRGYFALVTVIGLLIGVGSHPWTRSSPAGAVFKAWTRSDSGLAFRSTPRAVPLIALGLAVFLAAGVAAVSRWRPGWHVPVAGALIVLICVNQAALFRGQMVDRNLVRDEQLPAYWEEAAVDLDAGDRDTRVYELPGTDFASYRWGNTVDPVTPGLMDRDYAARELIPYGSPASANLLNQLDVPLQEGSFDPDSLAPVARLLGVGAIVHRADLQYERFRTPRPRLVHQMLLGAMGLGDPTGYGEAVPNTPSDELPLDDEVEYGTPDDAEDPAPVEVFPVEDPRPMVRTVSASAPVVMSGDGAGVVSLAAAGALDPDRPVLYAASFAKDPEGLRQALDEPDAELVVTDTNRRQARRWGSVRENDGYTERAGEEPLATDHADNRLELFPDAGDDGFTVSEQLGGATVAASDYGNPVSYTASDRAANAMDGDPTTAWRVGAFEAIDGEFLQIDLDEPVTTDHLTLLQSQRAGNRWITEVELTFDGGEPVTVALDDTSRTPPGQEIAFPERTFDSLRVAVTGTNLGELARYTGVSDVGIAEVAIPGVDPVVEVIRPPVDLLRGAGEASGDLPLTYLFTRRFANPAEVVVEDEERGMLRWVEGPVDRTFTPYGKARLSGRIPGEDVDALIGSPSAAAGGLTATSQSHLAGDPRSRAAAAVDGDDSTAWQTPVNGAAGNWIEVTYPQEVSFDRLPLVLVTDGRHSVPTRLSLQVDGQPGPTLDLGDVALGEGRRRVATTTVDVDTGPVSGTTFRFTVDAVHEVHSKDWFGGSRTVVPIGVAELGLPVTQAPPADDAPLPAACRDDLVTLDDRPVGMRVVGSVGGALSRRPLLLEACNGPVEIPAGRTLLRTAPGRETGFDVDLLALSSAAGGGPGPDTLTEPPESGPAPPSTTTERTGRVTHEVRVSDADEPYWVVMGQSFNAGWHARTTDGVDLGEPTLVNGFANGWRVDPARVGADATIVVEWTPQRLVLIALVLSAIGVLVCLLLLVWPLRLWAGRPIGEDRIGALDVVGIGPLHRDGAALPAGRAAGATLAVGVATWIAMGPWVALGVAAVTAVALLLGRGQVLLRAACLGLLVAAVGYVVLKQWRNGFIVDFDWMNKFELVHAWGLAAAALLAVDPLVEWLRRRGD